MPGCLLWLGNTVLIFYNSSVVNYLSLRRLYFRPDAFIYLLVCMHVCCQLFSKIAGPNCMKFFRDDLSSSKDQLIRFWERSGQGHEKVKNYWTELHGIFRDDLSSSKDQSIRFWKRSGQRSKTYFCHNTRSFHMIHMKPNAKCSFFNSLSSDMVTNVALAKLCSLPSARSSLSLVFHSSLCHVTL